MNDAPSFCWQCRGDLKSGSDGLIFCKVFDPMGNEHRVHRVCLDNALGDGFTAHDRLHVKPNN